MTGRYPILLIVVIVLLLSACASVEPQKQKTAITPEARPVVEVPSPVLSQAERAKKLNVSGMQEFFSFSLRDADIKDVLRAVAKQTNYNVVIEPDVKGISTVDLKNVTLPKALEYILEPLKYTFKIDDRTIYVSSPKLETRIFSINYLTMKRLGTSNLTGTVGGSSSSPGSTSGGTGTSSTTTSGGGSSGASGIAVNLSSNTESDLWKAFDDSFKSLLSKEGSFFLNKQAMLVLVTDYPKNLRNIAMLIEAGEESMHRQVLIEAKIVEVTLTNETREGVNWGLMQARIGEFMFAMNQTFLNPIPVVTPSTSAIAANPMFRFFVGSKNLDINNTFIDLLKTQGKVDIVSNPRISTLNNQRAVIKVARQDVYWQSQQTQGTGGSGNLATYTPQFLTVGLILDVTPQIDNDGNILLNIHPMLTEKVGTVKGPDGSEVPILDMREADTMARVKDGETVVIGGLIKDYSLTDVTGTKYLLDLPLVGRLFRLNAEASKRSELIVIMTPRIIWNKDTIR